MGTPAGWLHRGLLLQVCEQVAPAASVLCSRSWGCCACGCRGAMALVPGACPLALVAGVSAIPTTILMCSILQGLSVVALAGDPSPWRLPAAALDPLVKLMGDLVAGEGLMDAFQCAW